MNLLLNSKLGEQLKLHILFEQIVKLNIKNNCFVFFRFLVCVFEHIDSFKRYIIMKFNKY